MAPSCGGRRHETRAPKPGCVLHISITIYIFINIYTYIDIFIYVFNSLIHVPIYVFIFVYVSA